MQSFQKPLSAKEEQKYLERCKAGDRQARDCLIERNLRLVAYIAKKYQANEREMDDLISIGTIGLIKGIDSFDGSKNIRLATYCARCVDKAIQLFDDIGKTLSYLCGDKSSYPAYQPGDLYIRTYQRH